MIKFAVFVNNDGYRKYTTAAAKEGGASVPYIKDGIEKKFFEIHNAEPLNRKFELPFKSIWYRKCVDEQFFSVEDRIYFVFYESFHMTYSRKLLSYLKKKYARSKFIFYFSNPVGDYNLKRLNKIKDMFDAVITFNRSDAEKYGFTYYCGCDFMLLPDINAEKDKLSDLFFIGANKGRLELLLSVFEKMSGAGLKCDFWITDVPAEKQKYADVIHYNQKLTYDEVLQHDVNTKCILEVLRDGKQYYSIRTIEAFKYRKKLLTMNESVKSQWFFNPDIIQTFITAEDISIDFINAPTDESLYKNSDVGSFERFAEFIIEKFKQ